MESASITIVLGYRLSPDRVYNLREIFCRIIAFYCYRSVLYCNYYETHDPVESKWLYTFTANDNDGPIMITQTVQAKLLALSIESFIGMKLVSTSILAHMSSISKTVQFYYKAWGVLAEAKDIDYNQVRDIKKHVAIFEEDYHYFVKTPSVSDMVDKLDIYHSDFDRYVIVNKTHSVNDMMDTLRDILLSH